MAWDRRRRRFVTGPWAFVVNNIWLSVLAAAALGLLIAEQLKPDLFARAREIADDGVGSVMEVLSGPAGEVKKWGDGFSSFFSTYEENRKLRDELAKLRAGHSELVELKRKVRHYEQLLKVAADAPVTSVAARVIADASGPFVRTVLINAGRAQGVEKGHAVADERGLLGRIILTGQYSSRVLLLTDLNSRIPVMIEGANLKAILIGDNSERPTLEYLPPGSRLTAGARVVTASDGAVFPPGIAIGQVVKGNASPRVVLFASEGRSDFVRVLKYSAPIDVDVNNPETSKDKPAATPKTHSSIGAAYSPLRPS